jgi:hypothetical protein
MKKIIYSLAICLILLLTGCQSKNFTIYDIYTTITEEGNRVSDHSVENIYLKSDYVVIAKVNSKVTMKNYWNISTNTIPFCYLQFNSIVVLKGDLNLDSYKVELLIDTFSQDTPKKLNTVYELDSYFIFAGQFVINSEYLKENVTLCNNVRNWFPLVNYNSSISFDAQSIELNYYQGFIDLYKANI